MGEYMRNIQISVAAGLVIAFLILLGAGCAAGGGQPRWSPEGKVLFIDGELQINGAVAGIGDAVPADAVVTTGGFSMAELEFGRGNVIRLEENTRLELALAENAVSEIAIREGSFAAVLGSLNRLQSANSLNIRSSTAIAGVRGTSFYVRLEEPEVTYFCLCNGELDLGPVGQAPAPLSAAHHGAYRLISSGDSIAMRPAPLLYHDDAYMESLAEKAGVDIDWDADYGSGY
jgi:hypothetical protein